MTQDDRNRALIDCYRSGQMSEQQWQGHLREEPGLAEMWRATLELMRTTEKTAPVEYVTRDAFQVRMDAMARESVERYALLESALKELWDTLRDLQAKAADRREPPP